MNSEFDYEDATRKRQRMTSGAMNNMANMANMANMGNMAGMGYSQPNAGFFYGNQLSLPVDSFQAASALNVFPVVKLRGLPYSATTDDILMFFSGLEVIDVFLPGETGRASQGDAYVLFSSPLYLQFALQRNGQRMGKRWIEVYKVSRLAYCEAVVGSAHSSGVPQPQVHQQQPSMMEQPSQNMLEVKKDEVHTPILKMLGLPFSATPQDILNFFSGFNVVESSVQIVKNAEGRPTGTAFVEFSTVDEAKAAMSRHKENMGSRYIELFGSSREQVENVIRNAENEVGTKHHSARSGGLGLGLGGLGGFGGFGMGSGLGGVGMGGGFGSLGANGGGGGGGGYVPRPGDWLCPDEKCGTNNFSSRQQCFKCGTPRPK